jgi:PASTA domain
MSIHIPSLLTAEIAALNTGVSRNRALQLGLVGGFLGSPILAAVLVQTIAQSEVQASAPTALPPPAAPPSASEVGLKTIEMPTLRSTHRTTRHLSEARTTLKEKGFLPPNVTEFFVASADANVVIEQDPPPGARVIPAETEVNLTVTSKSENRGVGNAS